MKEYIVIVESEIGERNAVASYNNEYEAKNDVDLRIRNGIGKAYVAKLLITAERSVKFTTTLPREA